MGIHDISQMHRCKRNISHKGQVTFPNFSWRKMLFFPSTNFHFGRLQTNFTVSKSNKEKKKKKEKDPLLIFVPIPLQFTFSFFLSNFPSFLLHFPLFCLVSRKKIPSEKHLGYPPSLLRHCPDAIYIWKGISCSWVNQGW